MSFGDVLGLAGVVVGIVGFGLAIWQIVLAKRAIDRAITVATAIRDAVGHAEGLAAAFELMRTVPRLQAIERDLSVAAHDDNKAAASNHLQDWRNLAAETRGLLREQTYETAGLEGRLQESCTLAAEAMRNMPGVDVAGATKSAMTTIAAATEEAAVLMGQIRAHPPFGPTETS